MWDIGEVALVGSGEIGVSTLAVQTKEGIALAREETVLRLGGLYARAWKRSAAVYFAVS